MVHLAVQSVAEQSLAGCPQSVVAYVLADLLAVHPAAASAMVPAEAVVVGRFAVALQPLKLVSTRAVHPVA